MSTHGRRSSTASDLPRPERERLEGAAGRILARVHRLTDDDEARRGSLAVTNALVALYFRWLRIDPHEPIRPDRDRFVLGRRDALPALFSTLGEAGFLDGPWLDSPERTSTAFDEATMADLPGVEAGSEALGHGLGIAVGVALATRLTAASVRTVTLIDDDEFDDPSAGDVATVAVRSRLDNLIAIAVRAGSVSALRATQRRWESLGWRVRTAASNSVEDIAVALDTVGASSDAPVLLIVASDEVSSGSGGGRTA